MNDKKIKVLLSTYNGANYIKEQIDSILEQTYGNIEIYVRDDGSKDHTLKILEEYEKKKLIHLEKGQNAGFIKSFFSLVKNCGDADYFAFCDQDDVWMKDKIERAIKILEGRDSTKPLLYFSDYEFYDEKMNFVERVKSYKKPPTFRNSLVDCMSLGFNSVFNRTAREKMAGNIPDHSCGHDWWTYMLCAGLGEVIYDRQSTVKYRRHGKSVSPGGMDFVKFQLWRIKKFIVNDYFKNVRLQLREFESLYGKELSGENQKLLGLFTGERYNLISALKKAFYMKPFRHRIFDEIAIRCMFLIGKL